jgi:hypothetical protein
MSLKSSQSPRANRSSTQNPLEHAKGEVRFGTDRAGENDGADKVKSDLKMESINQRAAPK